MMAKLGLQDSNPLLAPLDLKGTLWLIGIPFYSLSLLSFFYFLAGSF
jgi:hypothetical protein